MTSFRDNTACVVPNPAMAESAGTTSRASSRDKELTERFTALFRTHYAYVWGTLRRFGVHAADAEDVAHEVFLRIYDKLGSFDSTRPEKPWCFAFIYRAACDYRKLARHRVEVMRDDDPIAEGPLADQGLEHVERAQLVHRALDGIDFERRAVLVAFEMDDVPMKAIAEAMSIPLFTAYSRLRLAREDFRVAIERLERKGGRQ